MGESPVPARARVRPRLLVFVVAYHAETTLTRVLRRIPKELARYDTEVLVIDDASTDGTFDRGESARRQGDLPFRLTVLGSPVNLGYGGNQKLGYRYAIENDFDFVALLHGDGQYAPEVLPDLLAPLLQGEADAVFGSRMMKRFAALKGGMPLYKYVGNKVLTVYENWILGSSLSEFHSGYRVYSVEALRRIPFELNTNAFHFDTEIIIQLLCGGLRIREVPIPTYYGDEICRVNGVRYAWDCVRAVTAARLQRYHLLYRRNLDVSPSAPWSNQHYEAKGSFDSSHHRALATVREGDCVIDLGCGPGVLAPALRERKCRVIGLDCHPPPPGREELFDQFMTHDLNEGLAGIDLSPANRVFLLDILEHLRSPEDFCRDLREAIQGNLDTRVVVTTPNVAYWIVRLMLLAGQFNYGKRGILDMTHTRLLTFSSARRLFSENGFVIEECSGIPPPIPLVVKNRHLSALLMRAHGLLTKHLPRLCAYQIFMILRPMPTTDALLRLAERHSADRRREYDGLRSASPSTLPA